MFGAFSRKEDWHYTDLNVFFRACIEIEINILTETNGQWNKVEWNGMECVGSRFFLFLLLFFANVILSLTLLFNGYFIYKTYNIKPTAIPKSIHLAKLFSIQVK